MNISNTYHGYNTYSAYTGNLSNSTEVSKKNDTKTDIVTISNEARELQKQESHLPIEAYAIPKWMESFIPEQSKMSPELNYNFFNYAESLRQDMTISLDERHELIKEYQNNDPMHQEWLAKDEFSRTNSKQLFEYGNLIRTYLNEAREEHGIMTTRDNYEKINLANNKSLDEKVHQSFLKLVNNDSKLLSLMNSLGVNNEG